MLHERKSITIVSEELLHTAKEIGSFYTPIEVGFIMTKIMDVEHDMEIYDPCCGSGGLLIKCELVIEEKMALRS